MILLWIALAGAAGAVLRYGVIQWSHNSHNLVIAGIAWPTGVLIVNVIGCLLAGLLIGWLHTKAIVDERLQLILLVGFLGAFTTFSAFAVDTLHLFKDAGLFPALGYVVVQNLICMGVVFLGYWLGKAVVPV